MKHRHLIYHLMWIAVIALTGLSCNPVGDENPAEPIQDNVVGNLLEKTREVKRKQDKNISWGDVETMDKLFFKDAVFVGAESKATIMLTDSSQLNVEQNSLIILEFIKKDQEKNIAMDFVEIRVLRGQMKVAKNPDVKTSVDKGSHSLNLRVRIDNTTSVVVNNGSQLVVARGSGETKFVVEKGAVTVLDQSGKMEMAKSIEVKNDHPVVWEKSDLTMALPFEKVIKPEEVKTFISSTTNQKALAIEEADQALAKVNIKDQEIEGHGKEIKAESQEIKSSEQSPEKREAVTKIKNESAAVSVSEKNPDKISTVTKLKEADHVEQSKVLQDDHAQVVHLDDVKMEEDPKSVVSLNEESKASPNTEDNENLSWLSLINVPSSGYFIQPGVSFVTQYFSHTTGSAASSGKQISARLGAGLWIIDQFEADVFYRIKMAHLSGTSVNTQWLQINGGYGARIARWGSVDWRLTGLVGLDNYRNSTPTIAGSLLFISSYTSPSIGFRSRFIYATRIEIGGDLNYSYMSNLSKWFVQGDMRYWVSSKLAIGGGYWLDKSHLSSATNSFNETSFAVETYIRYRF